MNSTITIHRFSNQRVIVRRAKRPVRRLRRADYSYPLQAYMIQPPGDLLSGQAQGILLVIVKTALVSPLRRSKGKQGEDNHAVGCQTPEREMFCVRGLSLLTPQVDI